MSIPSPQDRQPHGPMPLAPLIERERAVAGGVPAPLTSLVGREREIASACALLRRADIRLLTLSGPGGVGKTRLALRVATDLMPDFEGEVAFVPLATVTDPDLLLPTIAQALGVREAGHRPPTVLDRLTRVLRAKRRLLVLDNFEQIQVAAPRASGLLTACPGLKILATSRVVLRVQGEHEFPVSPLTLPEPGSPSDLPGLAQVDAIALFLWRARAVNPTFELTAENAREIAEICRRLDGLPLAIELAAGRSKVLPPPVLLARLERRLPLLTGGSRDLPIRQQTLRGAIAWSHDLLTPSEQVLFRRLAVFAGGFTLSAAEAVAGGGEVSEGTAGAEGAQGNEARASAPSEIRELRNSVLDGIAALVDQSLAHQEIEGGGEVRFRMLETIREFAIEQLDASGEGEAVRRRHAAWCLEFAELAERALYGPEQGRLLDQLEAEHDNLRAALNWAVSRGESTTSLRIACALWLFWLQRNHLQEGRRWFERALSRGEAAPAGLRGKAMLGMGGLAGELGDVERALAVGEECLALYRSLNDSLGMARSYQLLGTTALRHGDFDRAAAWLEQAVTGYANWPNERVWQALAMGGLAMATYGNGDRERAAELFEQAWDVRRDLGEAWPPSMPLPTLEQAEASRTLGEPGERHSDARPPSGDDDPLPAGMAPLTDRERAVLRLLVAGHSTRAIADELSIRPRTATTHVTNILNKLGVNTRAAAVALALRHGLV